MDLLRVAIAVAFSLVAAVPHPDPTSAPGPWGTLSAAVDELGCVKTYCNAGTAYCLHWVPYDSYDTQTGQFMNGDEVAGLVRTAIGEC